MLLYALFQRKIGERVVSRNVVVEEISVPTINEEFVHVDMSDVPAAAESDVLPVESKELQLQSSNEYEASEEVQKQNVKLEEKELGENSRAETDYSSPAE